MTDRDVLLFALETLRAGRPGVLATVVSVEGSAYQREGAKLFVDAAGNVTGLISGGCLEDEVAGAAKDAMGDRKARILRYDTADESIFGYGMGCPGIIDVLLEPLPQGPAAETYKAWIEALIAGDAAARAVSLAPAREGEIQQAVFGARRAGTLGDAALDAAAQARALQLTPGDRRGATDRLGPDGTEVYLDVAPAQLKLVVFGAGDDAQPLAMFAQAIGMQVRIVDPRPAMATPDRFPGAEISLLQPKRYPEVPLGPASRVVVMGHQMERDEAALAHALAAAVPYVGLLSSRDRRERMLSALEARGELPEDARRRLFAPIGLDIGAKSPSEIALAVVAEILAHSRGRSGASMSAR